MGMRYYRSVNFGPVRINFSKSGVGYSVGSKYHRITKMANGRIRETYNSPIRGLSYVKESSGVTRKEKTKQVHSNKNVGKVSIPAAILSIVFGIVCTFAFFQIIKFIGILIVPLMFFWTIK